MNVLLESGRINMEYIFESTHKNPLGKRERNVDKGERYHFVVLASKLEEAERRIGDLYEGISTSTREACPLLVLVTCDL
jgi:hypothetical protein